MASPLNEKEVHRLYQLLTTDQRNFLEDYLKQSKKSKWLQKLARKKGVVIREEMTMDEISDKLNDWELEEILDGGYGNRPYRCECGMPLRFCYIVTHRREQKKYRLGETCLANYTQLSPELIKDITNGFHYIDLERDDILKKVEQDWQLPDLYLNLELPAELWEQINAGLPLSVLQIDRLEQKFRYELRSIRQTIKRQRLAQAYEGVRLAGQNAYAREEHEAAGDAESISYDEIIGRHIDHLKLIREHENMIADLPMQVKWESVQQMIKGLKRGESFDYSKFLGQMFELLYYLKLY